ncbi:MAG: stage VI sporulation protein F [Bacilli bacterium]|nr:stage VI sporulation protein F [Bacilli bacterium]
MSDSFFDKIEEKTKVSKETIISLAKKLQEGNFKDEKTLRSIIKEISTITGKEVSREKEDKIIGMIKEDKVPKDMEKYI